MARPRPHLHGTPYRPLSAGALPTHDGDGRPLLRLQTLGAVSILVGELRVGASAGTLFSLLLRVCCAPARQVSRGVLRHALWPEQEELRQSANLRQALYKLRGYGVRIAIEGDTVALDLEQVIPTFSVERTAELFARDVTMGHEPFGPYLAGFAVPWPLLQEWIEEQREQVHSEVRRVLSEQLKQRRSRADWGGADALARWLLQFDPLNEEATLTVAECTALSGSKSEALAILDRYLAELGPMAGDIRLPAAMLRRRIAEPSTRGRLSFAPTERHFIGRQEELAALTLLMRRARWHDGKAVLLHAPPGMGKSRLLHELSKVAVIEGVRVAQTSCRESDMLRPLSVFLDLVPELLTQAGAIGCAPESLAALRRLVPAERLSVSALANSESARATAQAHAEAVPTGSNAVLDAAVSNAEAATVASPGTEASLLREPMPMVASLRRAIIDLVSAISEEKPTLLVVDDVHWIDEHSWEVLSDLIDRCHALRVFVLLTSREPHARLQRPQRTPVQLQVQAIPPLSAESCLLLSRAIGDDLSAPIDDALGAWFVRASEGVPLFLRALVNHWIETGEAGGVPPTLQGVIEQRLSQLSGDALRVLQTAALLGKWATVERVGAVLEMQVHQLLGAIDELYRIDSLRPQAAETILCHELLGQIACARLPSAVQAYLHTRIASELVRSAESSAPSAECELDIISHLHDARAHEEADDYSTTAVAALLRGDLPHRALAVCNHSLARSPSIESRLSFVCLYREALFCSGQYSRLLEHATTEWVSSTTPKTWDARNALEVIQMVEIADRAMFLGDFSDLCGRGLLVAQSVSVEETLRVRAAIAVVRASAMGVRNAIPQAAYELGTTLLNIANEDGQRRAELEMYFNTPFGKHAEAVGAAKSLLCTLADGRTPSERVRIKGDCAYALMCADLGAEASLLFEETRHEALRFEIYSRAAAAEFNLSIMDLAKDEFASAEVHATNQLRISRLKTDPFLESLALRNLARIALLGGDRSQARSIFDSCHSEAIVAAHPKWHAFEVAMRLGLALAEKERGEIARFLALGEKQLSSLGNSLGQDFLASRVLLGMRELDMDDSADRLAGKYVEVQRRESYPLPHYLRSLCP